MQPGNGHWPTPGMHRVAAPSTTLSRGEPPAIQSAVIQPFQLYGGAYSFGSLAESHLIPPPSLYHWVGFFFPDLVPSSDTCARAQSISQHVDARKLNAPTKWSQEMTNHK